eukprot:scaffold1466_cov249-Pinguiococcus_pyrenoidosus.AAC.13
MHRSKRVVGDLQVLQVLEQRSSLEHRGREPAVGADALARGIHHRLGNLLQVEFLHVHGPVIQPREDLHSLRLGGALEGLLDGLDAKGELLALLVGLVLVRAPLPSVRILVQPLDHLVAGLEAAPGVIAVPLQLGLAIVEVTGQPGRPRAGQDAEEQGELRAEVVPEAKRDQPPSIAHLRTSEQRQLPFPNAPTPHVARPGKKLQKLHHFILFPLRSALRRCAFASFFFPLHVASGAGSADHGAPTIAPCLSTAALTASLRCSCSSKERPLSGSSLRDLRIRWHS